MPCDLHTWAIQIPIGTGVIPATSILEPTERSRIIVKSVVEIPSRRESTTEGKASLLIFQTRVSCSHSHTPNEGSNWCRIMMFPARKRPSGRLAHGGAPHNRLTLSHTRNVPAPLPARACANLPLTLWQPQHQHLQLDPSPAWASNQPCLALADPSPPPLLHPSTQPLSLFSLLSFITSLHGHEVNNRYSRIRQRARQSPATVCCSRRVRCLHERS